MGTVDTARVDAALDQPLLAAQKAGTLTDPIIWPASTEDAPPRFVRVRRSAGPSYRSAVSHNARRGMLQIECCGPIGDGEAPMNMLAKQVAALYPQDTKLDSYVRILMADVLPGLPIGDGTVWMVPVQIDWIVEFA